VENHVPGGNLHAYRQGRGKDIAQVKSHGGLTDITFVPGRGSPLIDEGNPGGVKLALPDIEIDRGNLHPGSQGFSEIAHERFFQPGDLPPNKSAAGPREEKQNHQNSQDNAKSRSIHKEAYLTPRGNSSTTQRQEMATLR